MHSGNGPGRRGLVALAAAVAVLVPMGFVAVSAAEPIPGPGDAVAACHDHAAAAGESGWKFCRGFEQSWRALGHACRYATTNDDELCARVDERRISEAAMSEYEASWTAQALRAQHALDRHAPLAQAFVPHTHNANNSVAYMPSLSGLDHNQQYSVTDQLRMGVRGIELDTHWQPSVEGRPEHGMRAPVLCHAQEQGAGPVWVHPGCTWERHLRHDLAEIAAWLAEPGNEQEVLIVYLEDHLEGNAMAFDAAVATIEAELGDSVYRPAGPGCTLMPLSLTKAAILASGAQVMLVGNCGGGSWNAWVHGRGNSGASPQWRESSSAPGDDFDCAADRQSKQYDTQWIRYWDDSTWLSATAATPGEVTLAETAAMTGCGVNFIGFDQLHPGDPRLSALVWSWAPGELPTPGACPRQDADGRWRNTACGDAHRYACHGPAGWMVTAASGPAGNAASACSSAGAAFRTPWNGWENGLIRSLAGTDPVWVAA